MYKANEWLYFECDLKKIKKLFKTEKERKTYVKLHSKFCSCNISPFQHEENINLTTCKSIT